MLAPESVLIRDGEAIAQLQENVTAQPVSFGKGAAAPLEIKDDGGSTLLATLNTQLGRLARASARSTSARWAPAGRSCWTCVRRTRSSYSRSTSGTATGPSTWPSASSPPGPGTSR
ncbi:hypothetical protein [Arthrobacter sp. ISL-85]|uniref:hypothetical protein n=1 Tax=Arthrobacter sp. ISL-85 TaxID=2819115 RepID=UPI0037C11BC7